MEEANISSRESIYKEIARIVKLINEDWDYCRYFSGVMRDEDDTITHYFLACVIGSSSEVKVEALPALEIEKRMAFIWNNETMFADYKEYFREETASIDEFRCHELTEYLFAGAQSVIDRWAR